MYIYTYIPVYNIKARDVPIGRSQGYCGGDCWYFIFIAYWPESVGTVGTWNNVHMYVLVYIHPYTYKDTNTCNMYIYIYMYSYV
jgi:hypothetical protein